MIDWIKKRKVLFALICVAILLLLIGVPFIINILFKISATTDIFAAEWSAGDALGYYGAILSFIGTVVLGALALYQNHIIKTEADEKAARAEEQERAENMPRFFMRFQGAGGFCGSLKFAVMNVSNNIAYNIDVYDIKIKDGSKTIWESDDTYGAPVINPQKEMVIQTKSPAANRSGEFTFFATMSCMDKYDDKHEYILKMTCRYPNHYGDTKTGDKGMTQKQFERWATMAERLRDEALVKYANAKAEEEKARIAEEFKKAINCY